MIWVLLLKSLLLNHISDSSTQMLANPIRKSRNQCLSNTSDCRSGAVVALFTAGAFFGAGFAGPTTEYTGRRWTITIGSVIFMLGGALQTGAPEISYLMAGRFLAGLGVGFLTMIIPLYQAEIAHPSIRGTHTHTHTPPGIQFNKHN
jgi:MFS family permease